MINPLKIIGIKIVSLLLCFNIYASEIQRIEKGELSPYRGFLISDKMEKKFRLINEENIRLNSLNSFKDEKIDILEKRLEIRDNFSKDLLEKSKPDNSFLTNSAYFILGALVTVGIGYSLVKITR